LGMAPTDKATRGRRDVEVDDRAIRWWRSHNSAGQPPAVTLLLTYNTVTPCICSWLCVTVTDAVIS